MTSPLVHLDDAAMHRLVHRSMVLAFATALGTEAPHLAPIVYGPFEPGPMEALANALEDAGDSDPLALLDRVSLQAHPLVHDFLPGDGTDFARGAATLFVTVDVPAGLLAEDPLAAARILARMRRQWAHRSFSLSDAHTVGAPHRVRVEGVVGEYTPAAAEEAVAVRLDVAVALIFEREAVSAADAALEPFPPPPTPP